MGKGQPHAEEPAGRVAARPDLVAVLLDPATTRVSAGADLPPDALRAVAALARAAGVTLDGVPEAEGDAGPNDGALRVASVRVHRVVLPLRRLYVSAMYLTDRQPRALVELRLRGGAVGWGECPDAAAHLLPKAARAFLGADLARGVAGPRGAFARIGFDNRDGRNGWAALAAVEMAAWDALARARGLPLAALLGGAAARPLPVACPLPAAVPPRGATRADLAPHMADRGNAARVADLALEMAERHGVAAFKYKSAGVDPEWDVACMTALRRALPDARMRFDPNAAYGTAAACDLGARLHPLGLEFLEDPCDGIEGLARLAAALPEARIATNMAVIEPPHLLAAHRRGLRCVVLGDPFLWGGLEGMREMAGAARLLGLTPAVHSFYESAVATAAAAHLAAALDLDRPHPVDCGVPGLAADVAEGVEVRGGMLRVPEGPGSALAPDPARLGAGEPAVMEADR